MTTTIAIVTIGRAEPPSGVLPHRRTVCVTVASTPNPRIPGQR
ncbi:hypothetical protein [Streptomyces albidochromogenes]|nr:hypothetical protein [Streptomyces albidochromogenes]